MAGLKCGGVVCDVNAYCSQSSSSEQRQCVCNPGWTGNGQTCLGIRHFFLQHFLILKFSTSIMQKLHNKVWVEAGRKAMDKSVMVCGQGDFSICMNSHVRNQMLFHWTHPWLVAHGKMLIKEFFFLIIPVTCLLQNASFARINWCWSLSALGLWGS